MYRYASSIKSRSQRLKKLGFLNHKKVLDICSEYMGDKFRLKALRYYENFGGQSMQWHTDNRYYDGSNKEGINTKK